MRMGDKGITHVANGGTIILNDILCVIFSLCSTLRFAIELVVWHC